MGEEADRIVERMSEPVQLCEWFATCARPATTTVYHPIIGDVPVCRQCLRFIEKNSK
jgi:hypothetical protein